MAIYNNEEFTTTLSADGDTDTLFNTQTKYVYTDAIGDFGGGSLAYYVSSDGANWITAKDLSGVAVSFTSDNGIQFESHVPLYYKATLSGATAPDLDVKFELGE